jgi:hypothetical protein
MTFEFTPRIALFFTRYLEIEKMNLIKKTAELILSSSEEIDKHYDECYGLVTIGQIYFKGWGVRFVLDYERDDDGDGNIIPKSLNLYCDMVRSVGSYRSDVISIGRHDLSLLTDEKPWLDSLVKTYITCACEKKIVKKDGYCSDCYPYVCSQADDCCICKENEGVWVELKCKHILHEHCWRKTVGKKCPLCRKEQEHKFSYDKI